MGYLNDEEKTKEAIDEEGWLHSGDIGRVDKDGFLYITGRIKGKLKKIYAVRFRVASLELIITSGGENIAPVPIENTIKSELPFLSNVFLVGDKKKYLTCLVTMQTEVDLHTGEPKDELTAHAKSLLEQMGSTSTTVSEILGTHDIVVNEAIRDGIQRANKHAISNAQRVSHQPSHLLQPHSTCVTLRFKSFLSCPTTSPSMEGNWVSVLTIIHDS